MIRTYAVALQFHQMRQKLGVSLHMENEARHISLSGLCHERLTPQAQQRLLALKVKKSAAAVTRA
jgi:hypothetical protein